MKSMETVTRQRDGQGIKDSFLSFPDVSVNDLNGRRVDIGE